jgi:nucleotide-binding universal stress UspA family protein
MIAKGVEVAKSCGTDSIVMKIGDGDPGANIVKYADEVGADPIVTGRRGLGDVAGLFLGSTSHGISKYAKCACLSVA